MPYLLCSIKQQKGIHVTEETALVNVDTLISEAVGDCSELRELFLDAQALLGDEHVVRFIEKVQERGEGLLLRFRAYQAAVGTADFKPNFRHFIFWTVLRI